MILLGSIFVMVLKLRLSNNKSFVRITYRIVRSHQSLQKLRLAKYDGGNIIHPADEKL